MPTETHWKLWASLRRDSSFHLWTNYEIYKDFEI